MIDRTLSHYRIDARLGEGGMGVVYRARDLRLERDVALKVLPALNLGNDEARRRFRREALALSTLNHPHIATVHDFDSDEGVDFLVMELVEGETLAARIARGPLAESEAIAIAKQLARALEAAHSRGVLHRDLKPGNVMVSPQGHAKILDFGLAKRLQEDEARSLLTEDQTTLGTLAYMSPEQMKGEDVEGRADLYSLGVVLFEMLVGQRPFEAVNSYALANAVINSPAPSARALREDVSPALDALAARLLAKRREDRPASAGEALRLLERCEGAPTTLPGASREPATVVGTAPDAARKRRRIAPAYALIAIVLVLIVGATVVIRHFAAPAAGGAPGMESLAVLPLENVSGDPSQVYFADGMTDELITRLAQVGSLRVIARAAVMQFRGSHESLRDIARRLGVREVVTGSVLRSGNRARITAQLVRASTAENLWAESYEGGLEDVITLQSQVARSIVEKIRVRLTPRERAALSKARSVNPGAHEAYLRGRFYWHEYSEDGFHRAVEQFELALKLDPTYAEAYAGLADAFTGMSSLYVPAAEAMPRARAAAERALALDPNVAEAHATLAYVKGFFEWRWDDAEAEIQRALEINPGSEMAHWTYSYMLLANGRTDEALAQVERAREIDPLSELFAIFRGILLHDRRDDVAAEDALREALATHPDAYLARNILGQIKILHGDPAGGAADIQKSSADDPQNSEVLGWLGYAYARAGQRTRALALIRSLDQLSKKAFVQPYAYAIVYLGLNDRDRMYEWLEKAVEKRSEDLVFLKVQPEFDRFRKEPRFIAILAKLGFQGTRPAA